MQLSRDVRLLAGESRILPNALHVGSAIEQIGMAHVYPMKSESLPELIISLGDARVIRDGFFIDSSHGMDIIDNVMIKFRSHDTNCPIYSISGSAIRIHQKLLKPGKRDPFGMIRLPFPVAEMARYYYDAIEVVVKFKNPMRIRDYTRKILSKHLESNVASIACDYAFSDIRIELWSRCISESRDEEDRKMRDRYPHMFPIIQCQEEIRDVAPMASDIVVATHIIHLLHKVTLVFYRADDLLEEPFDILESGDLELSGHVAFSFTGRSTHVFDKTAVGSYVPDEPIYTLTFESEPLNLNPKRAHSRVNFNNGSNPTFRLKIKPQPFPVMLRIIGENLNMILVSDGSGCVRYCR